MVENSPAFQRRDSGERLSSPEGTAGIDCFNRPSGTYPLRTSNPAFQRRAIFGCPSGTGRASPTSNPLAVLDLRRRLRLPGPALRGYQKSYWTSCGRLFVGLRLWPSIQTPQIAPNRGSSPYGQSGLSLTVASAIFLATINKMKISYKPLRRGLALSLPFGLGLVSLVSCSQAADAPKDTPAAGL